MITTAAVVKTGVPSEVLEEAERLGLEIWPVDGEWWMRTISGRTLGRYNPKRQRLYSGADGLVVDDLAQALVLVTAGRQRVQPA